jgi:hypothetical protein
MAAADPARAASSSDDGHLALTQRIEQLPRLVNEDADLVRRGAWVDLQFQLGLGEVPYHLTIAGGKIVGLDRGPLLMRASRFQIRATSEAWRKFWEPVPEPGWHDLLALTKRGVARIDGDLHPLLANLQYFKDALAAPRRLPQGAR